MLRIINPYPGFENGFYKPFTESDANLFFGRSQEIATIKLKLRQKRLVCLVSESKVGVTSLLRAGIIPNLRTQLFDGLNGKRWRCLYVLPGENPIFSLAQAIVNPYNKLSDKLKPSMEEDVYQKLMRNDYGLLRVLEDIIGDQSFNIMIAIDELIEVFDKSVEDRVRRRFLNLIQKVLQDKNSPVYFITSLKVDNFRREELKESPKFYSYISAGLFKIKFLNKDALKKAIEIPAQFGQSEISPDLSTELIFELLHDDDQLRKLQLLMSRTWLEWKRQHKDRTVGKEHFYKATGQRAKAVSKSLSKSKSNKMTRRKSSSKSGLGSNRGDVTQIGRQDYNKLTEREKQWFKLLIPQLLEITPDGEIKSIPSDIKQMCKIMNFTLEELGAFVTKIPTVVAMDSRKISIHHIEIFEEWKEIREWVKKEAELKSKFVQIADASILHYIDGIDVKSVISRQQYRDIFEWYDPTLLTKEWAKNQHPNYELGLDFIDKLQQTYGKVTPKTKISPKKKLSFKKSGDVLDTTSSSSPSDDGAKAEAMKILGIEDKSNVTKDESTKVSISAIEKGKPTAASISKSKISKPKVTISRSSKSTSSCTSKNVQIKKRDKSDNNSTRDESKSNESLSGRKSDKNELTNKNLSKRKVVIGKSKVKKSTPVREDQGKDNASLDKSSKTEGGMKKIVIKKK